MNATVFLYHDVVPGGDWRASGFDGADADIYKLDAAEFEAHLAAIAQRSPVPASRVDRPPDGSAAPLVLTFDDGGASAVEIAGMLERYGWPGHFLMTAGRVGHTGFLDGRQLRDLHARGHVIGSHSYSHPLRMAALSRAQLEREWRDSAAKLADILGAGVEVASIPGGYYGRHVAEAAATAGIRHLFTSEPTVGTFNVDGCRVYGRFCVQQGVSKEWAAAVAAGERLPRWKRKLFWDAKKVAKRLGGESWLRFRKRVLEARSRRA